MRCARLCAPFLLFFGCVSVFSLNTGTVAPLLTSDNTTTTAVNIVPINGTSGSTVKNFTPTAATTTTKKTTPTKKTKSVVAAASVTSVSAEEVVAQKQDEKKTQKKSHAVDARGITTTTATTTPPTTTTVKNGSVGVKTTKSTMKSKSTVKTAAASKSVTTLTPPTSARSTTPPTTTSITPTSTVTQTTIATASSTVPLTTTVATPGPPIKSPVAFVVSDDDGESQAAISSSTTVGGTINTGDGAAASFPHFIHHPQFGTKVRLCMCNETNHCANEAFIHLDACKRQCVVTLEEFNRVEPEELMECFPDMDEELMALDRCVRSNVNNMCSKDDDTIVYIDPPAHSEGAATTSDNNPRGLFSYFAVTDPLEGVSRHGVQVKKARKTFIRLRSYQKCTAHCVFEKSVACQHESKCVARLPPIEQLDLILAECEGTKFYKHSHDSCKCMAHTKRVRKLIGICPFMLNRAVLRRL